jgi:antitoxin MazE
LQGWSSRFLRSAQSLTRIYINDIHENNDIQERMMRVSQWGNSLAVRLPKQLVDGLKLKPGDELLVVEAKKTEIAVEKIDRRAAFLKAMEQFHFPLPEGYKFDRDEANGR